MPDGPATFPVQKPTARFIRRVGRQSAILAKTLFANRFPRMPKSGQTRGIRVGGRGFQMIKEALRESTGFEVFCGPRMLVRCTILVEARRLRGGGRGLSPGR
jgi:hypothetical protein